MTTFIFVHDALTKYISSRFSINFEADTSEFQENPEELKTSTLTVFPWFSLLITSYIALKHTHTVQRHHYYAYITHQIFIHSGKYYAIHDSLIATSTQETFLPDFLDLRPLLNQNTEDMLPRCCMLLCSLPIVGI